MPNTKPMSEQSMSMGAAPNLTNPGAAMQTPTGLLGQNVQIAPNQTPRPISIPEQVMFEAMMRRMQV